MAGDDLDLSEFEEFSSTAKERAGRTSSEAGRGAGKGGKRAARPRRWPWFLTGLVLGGAIAFFGPDLAAPYLPPILRAGGEEVRGPVVGKRVGDDRVLLTVDTDRGALLATFRQRVPEIDLLVEEGDTVTLGIPEYAPLIEDPVLSAVRKGSGGAGERSGRSAEDASPAQMGSEVGASREAREAPAAVEGEPEDRERASPPEDTPGSGAETPASAAGDSSSSGT